MQYLSEQNRHNITIDMQGFTPQPLKPAVFELCGTNIVDLV